MSEARVDYGRGLVHLRWDPEAGTRIVARVHPELAAEFSRYLESD